MRTCGKRRSGFESGRKARRGSFWECFGRGAESTIGSSSFFCECGEMSAPLPAIPSKVDERIEGARRIAEVEGRRRLVPGRGGWARRARRGHGGTRQQRV